MKKFFLRKIWFLNVLISTKLTGFCLAIGVKTLAFVDNG